MQAKSEKDKAGMERDLQEARGGLEEAMRDRANMEKNCKMSQALIVEGNQKLDELARALNEADSTKKKLQVESQDLNRQIEETENAIANLNKNKRLIAGLQRRKKSSTTPGEIELVFQKANRDGNFTGRTTAVPWNPCRPLWRRSRRRRPRHSASRRSLRETSTSLRLPSTMPTRPTTKL